MTPNILLAGGALVLIGGALGSLLTTRAYRAGMAAEAAGNKQRIHDLAMLVDGLSAQGGAESDSEELDRRGDTGPPTPDWSGVDESWERLQANGD